MGMVPDWALTGWRSPGRCLARPGLDASFIRRDGVVGVSAHQRPGEVMQAPENHTAHSG